MNAKIKRLPVIDVDAPDDARTVDIVEHHNDDTLENAYFVRLRPRDCENTPRPCRYEACRYHNGKGSPQTCAIDVADSAAGRSEDRSLSLTKVATIMGISDAAVAQTQRRALAKLAALREEVEAEMGLGPDGD